MKTRITMLLGAVCWMACPRPCHAEPPAKEVRQVIIRAPELEVIKLTTGLHLAEDELAARLCQAVKEGRASVVSDVSSAADDLGKVEVKSGRYIWLPTELDQEFDWLYMVPVSFEEQFIGTSLMCSLVSHGTASPGDQPLRSLWQTRYAPRGPVTVKWPTSWLNVDDHQSNQPTNEAIHGWLDWRDVFEESLTGEKFLTGNGYHLLAILPPADQVWPGERDGRWLDVFLAKVSPSEKPLDASAGVASSPPLPILNRSLYYGIALDAGKALGLTHGRDPEEDEALLQQLLTQVEKGQARMILCAGSANDRPALPGSDASQPVEMVSARWHQYPTEMPSIPSAWEAGAVGTRLSLNAHHLDLHQALALPARTEWKLAQDVPETIMWQPRFRDMEVQTQLVGPGTRLISLQQVPEVMHGDGIPAGESVLIFSRQESAPRAETMPVAEPAYEAELTVLEVPAAEEADWQPADEKAWQKPDAIRYQQLLDRVHSGSGPAKLAAHGLLHCRPGARAVASIAEVYPTATEFDPPEHPNSPRMRPTALETLPVGTRWEVELQPLQPGEVGLQVTHSFLHSTARPTEPSLEETLAIAATTEAPTYPGAVHLTETWTDTDLKLVDGKPRCLGVRKPEGLGRDVRHVAFIRVRKVNP